MTLRSDDGTILQPKEAIVLDQDGEMIANTATSQSQEGFNPFKSKIHVLNSWWSPLILVLMGGALALGVVFIGGFLALLAALWLLRSLLRSLGLKA